MFQYQLHLTGLNCMGCARKAEAAFNALPNTQVQSITPTQAVILSDETWFSLNQALAPFGYVTAQQLHFSLSGLHCGRCVAKVKAAFEQWQTVDELQVEKTHLFICGQFEVEAVISQIEALGFEAQIAKSNQDDIPAEAMSTEAIKAERSKVAVDEKKSEEANLHFIINGMTCASCVSSVEKSITQIEGVTKVQVNLAEQTAWVTAPTISADKATIISDAIKNAGYQAELVIDEASMREQQQAKFQQSLKINQNNAIAGLIIGTPLMAWGVLGGNMMIRNSADQLTWGVIGLVCLALLATAGRPFFSNAWQALQHKRATMDTLVALGTGAAWFYSMLVVVTPSWLPVEARHVYFEASAMIIGLISLGHYIEAKAKARTTQSLQALIDLQPKTATVIIDGIDTPLAIEKITAGMQIRVKPGEQIPVDGKVVQGESYINEAMLTGEPLAPYKQIDDAVFTGTINQDGSLVIRATMVGSHTTLARIIKMVRQAQSSKPQLAKLADKISAVFVPVVVCITIFAALVWYAVGPAPQASYMLVVVTTVLIIACPCALGLATPLSVTVGIGKAAELGILIKDAEVLQTASKINTVVFDKTGTLTQGKPSVQQVERFGSHDPTAILTAVYHVEAQSEHPLAQAVCAYIKQQQNIDIDNNLAVTGFSAKRGLGVQASISDNGQSQTVYIGSPRYLRQNNIDIDVSKTQLTHFEQRAFTPIAVAIDDQLVALIGVSDPIRDDAKPAVDALQKQGIKVVLLSGDNQKVAQAIGDQLGIKHVISEVLPQQKAEKIIELQNERVKGKQAKVAMVGDGVNDAPALAQADAGIAMGSGSDVAIESAQMTLLHSSPLALVDAIELSQATVGNIKQNLFGAFVYNSLGIPVAAGVLYPMFGFMLSPVFAGAAMALSSITVVSNANRLRLFKPSRTQYNSKSQ
ncbi:copper-translocating P-type ATPase [Vibrio sp. S11_S32]|uniref:heavy metal translocating P-type ATPase n=1 Tax=Vibrio sp. S11_S32 TaxID=2720225 RepID=UPI0016803620|nr:heavy metal translocating P-type ATPase [Vibrio sp. S11_S32]MBD1574991.1 copper-translocating P-type ATPase [Vibrio sp. S11_S32]